MTVIVFSVFKIRKFVLETMGSDAMNTRSMIIHGFAFGLYLIVSLFGVVTFALYLKNPKYESLYSYT